MWKVIGIGCGVLLALGVAVVVAAIILVPKLIGVVQKELAEENARQALAAGWAPPDKGGTPAKVFPPAVGGYKLDLADDKAAVPDLNLDAKGVHAVFSSGASRVEVFAYPVTKLEAEALINRVERASEESRNRVSSKVDMGDSYKRLYLSASGLGQNHIWFMKEWLLVFRSPDSEDREPFVRDFLQAPRRP